MQPRVISVVLALCVAITLGSSQLLADTGEAPVWFPAIENGDSNGDWDVDLSDVIYLFGWLYLGGPSPAAFVCPEASLRNGDTNGDGDIDLSDGIYLLSHLFLGGPGPVEIPCGTSEGTGASTTQRPLSDLISTQGTFCQDILGNGGCYLFVPPAPNFLGWSNDIDTNDDGVPDRPLLFSGVDYAGLANGFFGDLFGTRLSGSVTERPLADGRAEVSVVLQTRRANGWVIALDPAGDVLAQIADGPTLFGHRPEDVAAGAGAALGDSLLHVVFVNTAPGATLPDLLQVAFAPEASQELKALRFLWRGAGPLTALFGVPEGTPGRCTIQQNGVLARGATVPDGDGFTAEFINLSAVGR